MTAEEIKASTTFRAVVEMCGFHVKNGFICCPFHNEKTPSFHIRPKTGICYGCGWEGDIFRFYMDLNHCTFPTAFLALGGTYDNEGKSKRDIAMERVIRLKQAALKAAEDRRRKAEVRRMYKEASDAYWDTKDAFTFARVLFEPFSDEWCRYLEAFSDAQIGLSIAEEEVIEENERSFRGTP